jgi:dolichol-phosphate mannosyltransferase
MPGPAWIVLPTYREADNVERMVHALRAVAPPDARVLIVDDASPDGTGLLADRLAAADPQISVLHRSAKRGLGPAYIAGFDHALAHGAGTVCEIDCDFSHDPAVVPQLIEACASGADLALGSRYVPGGGTRNWGLVRRVISRGGSMYARIVLGVGVRDLTGGFKCFRREVLETIALAGVTANGYTFQIEMTYRTLRKGFRVVEVPITFVDRVAGGSKMSRAIVLEAVWKVPALRWRAMRGRL